MIDAVLRDESHRNLSTLTYFFKNPENYKTIFKNDPAAINEFTKAYLATVDLMKSTPGFHEFDLAESYRNALQWNLEIGKGPMADLKEQFAQFGKAIEPKGSTWKQNYSTTLKKSKDTFDAWIKVNEPSLTAKGRFGNTAISKDIEVELLGHPQGPDCRMHLIQQAFRNKN